MKWLLLGHSRIAQRRVLPALRSQGLASSIAIASRRAMIAGADTDIVFYGDFDSAIASSGADVAYVSLENSGHALWAERALQAGLHVVVDKPAFLSYEDAKRLVALAKSRGRCLAEAIVFGSHPQIQLARRLFADAPGSPTRILAAFSFPPLQPSDFRYREDQGGGALYDIGPYVAATSRLFFETPPRTVSCRITEHLASGLDIGFSVLLTYGNNGALAGHFGFNTEYQNRLLLFGPGLAIEAQRAFTLPPETAIRLAVRRNNVEETMDIPPADAFGIFLKGVVHALQDGDWEPYSQALLEDAAFLSRLIQVARSA